MVENPFYFGSGKISVKHQSGIFPDIFFQAPCLEFIADIRGAAALPDDGVVYRFPGSFFPDDGRLSLIGYADGGDFFRGNSGGGKKFADHTALRSPYFHRVMFHPSGFGINLRKFLLCCSDNISLVVIKDGS